ncbi:hypothetical protein EV195_103128 [Tenacibaculum skagerrakense]|uniref:Outer membrane protein with beta-barrel domain n=1 Tax=Tenacibaculum skagerrakense TaxID=186571 RepID=A0A4R2NVZ3_9FLAO|nr:hypothetical protein [Tenacibaculum skagerrakense]TCP25768.1 hypothetical protein EV195_103128 [Tenacibaculum skagerrakense]
MKKFLLTIAMVAFGFAANAQDDSGQTSKGKFVIEANTGSLSTGSTAFSFSSTDGVTSFSLGLDGGYFFMDDLAVKAGLGYVDLNGTSLFNYKIGAEYYIDGQFPVGVDFTGSSSDGASVNWIGLQAGYAYFLAENVSVKPTVRYNVAIEDGVPGTFQGLIGFALYF